MLRAARVIQREIFRGSADPLKMHCSTADRVVRSLRRSVRQWYRLPDAVISVPALAKLGFDDGHCGSCNRIFSLSDARLMEYRELRYRDAVGCIR